ncbi:MAG: hypothetical protein PG981_000303 [Wolbachia endosymbiont of Ctenocephalides orientis wCori]|nr:MAG: hypothetical protein PG981_000303 [Wolbachia endosymbiont of Ctenocephalides orientis wCori]
MKILNVADANTKEALVQMISKAIDNNQWSSKKAAHALQAATTDIYNIKMLKAKNLSLGRLLIFLVRLDYKVIITIKGKEVVKEISCL